MGRTIHTTRRSYAQIFSDSIVLLIDYSLKGCSALNSPFLFYLRTDKYRMFIINIKTMKKETARIETRLPYALKQLFEEATYAGGYRNLTDFILSSAREKANNILKQKEEVIILSEKDAEIFAEVLLRNDPPNEKLKELFNDYKLNWTN